MVIKGKKYYRTLNIALITATCTFAAFLNVLYFTALKVNILSMKRR